MDTLKTILRIAIGLALLAILLPLFVWVGLAAVGITIVGGIIAAFAGNRMMRKANAEGGYREYTWQKTRWDRARKTRPGDGIIIDHE